MRVAVCSHITLMLAVSQRRKATAVHTIYCLWNFILITCIVYITERRKVPSSLLLDMFINEASGSCVIFGKLGSLTSENGQVLYVCTLSEQRLPQNFAVYKGQLSTTMNESRLWLRGGGGSKPKQCFTKTKFLRQRPPPPPPHPHRAGVQGGGGARPATYPRIPRICQDKNVVFVT